MRAQREGLRRRGARWLALAATALTHSLVSLASGVAFAQTQPAPAAPPAPAPAAAAPPPGASAPATTPSWASSTPSFSGTDLLPSSPPAPPPSAALPAPEPSFVGSQNDRIRFLEARVTELEERTRGADSTTLEWLRRFKVTGYLQPQVVAQVFNAAGSPNASPSGELPPGVAATATLPVRDGGTTNRTAFRFRRARLKVTFAPSDASRFVLEIEPFTPPDVPANASASPGFLRNTEAIGIVRWGGGVTSEFALGIFRVPFGYELVQSSADRPFVERSWGAQNMFPGFFDTGARADLRAVSDKVHITLAVVNGHTLGERTFGLVPDLTRSKDLVARGSFTFGPAVIGSSAYFGFGQIVDGVNIRLKKYVRWAYDAEVALQGTLFESLGTTRLLGELTIGQNMDRGVFYPLAVPVIAGSVADDVGNRKQLAAWGRLEQQLTKWVTAGARAEWYAPDTAQGGGRMTFGGSVGLHPAAGLTLLSELSHARDDVSQTGGSGSGPMRRITTISSVLQARF